MGSRGCQSASTPRRLFEPRYHQYSRETLPAECSALLEQDGPLLGARFVERDAIAWHALPVAFETTRALCDFARDPAHRGGLERAIIEPCLRADRDGTEWLALDPRVRRPRLRARLRARVAAPGARRVRAASPDRRASGRRRPCARGLLRRALRGARREGTRARRVAAVRGGRRACGARTTRRTSRCS
jgi:hypothetical protein